MPGQEYSPPATDHPTVNVPIEGEPASAASLIGIKQVADITAYLKTLIAAHQGTLNSLSDAAHVNQYNAFQREQYIQAPAGSSAAVLTLAAQRADAPLLFSSGVPSDHGAGNTWKLIGRWKRSGGGRYIALYVGSDAANYGGVAIVMNAIWNPDTQQWAYDGDNSQAAMAYVLRASSGDTGKFVVMRRDAGQPSPWTNAQWGVGNIEGWDLVSGRDFVYTVPKSRTVAVPLSTASPYGYTNNNAVNWAAAGLQIGPGGGITIPLSPPSGGKLGKCRLKFQVVGVTSANYRLRGYSMAPQMDNPTAPPLMAATINADGTASDWVVKEVDYASLNTALGVQYFITFEYPSGSPGTYLDLRGIDMTFDDPGPRNF